MQELIRLATPKNNPPQFVLDKVLGLIQTWADAFQGDPDLQEFRRVYDELREKGCEFPMTDLDRIPPIHTPARSIPASSMPVQQPRGSSTSPTSNPNYGMESDGSSFGQLRGPTQLGSDQMAKLNSEFDIVHQNCRVLGDMLTENTPGQVPSDDWQLMRELNIACRQMQQRIVELISNVDNEIVTGELLEVNDALNNVLLRYERFERLCGANTANESNNQPSLEAVAAPAPSYDSAVMSQRAVTSSFPQQSKPSSVQTATLVDLGDVSLTTTSGNAAKVEDKEFDMFAQSRQSFEENLPRANRSAYQNQEEDQISHGLAAAVTAKSRGTTFAGDKEVDEMEQWLKDTEVTNNAKESATSSEFDSFLATRSKETNASDEPASNQRTNRGGRSLQTAEDEQALFSL